jgi:regulator of RNase E activity RraA
MLHKAINMAQPGDVIVVNGQGDTGRALFGELMARSAAALKVAGLVFDGAVRDIDALADVRLPVFARASTPAGPFKNGPGEIGYPVACGGVVCMSGDIVLADADGVVVVPQADAPRVLENARAKADSETKRRREIANGTPYRAGIDEELVQKGVLEI